MSEMLNDRCLAAFEVCKASLDFPKRSLDIKNVRPNGAELRQHHIFRVVDHASPLARRTCKGKHPSLAFDAADTPAVSRSAFSPPPLSAPLPPSPADWLSGTS